MVLPEIRITVVDPQCRYLTLEQMIGPSTIPARSWQATTDNLIQMQFNCTWISAQGPGRVLDKLNKLDMIDAHTRKPFIVISQEQYNAEIMASCVIL